MEAERVVDREDIEGRFDIPVATDSVLNRPERPLLDLLLKKENEPSLLEGPRATVALLNPPN